MIVAVIGGSGSVPASMLEKAESVGRELARNGCTLLCGGLGGVMEAACRGAAQAGGTTIGVLPGSDPEEANPYVQIPIATGMGEARNMIIALTAEAVIAVAGEYGTLTEIAHALHKAKPVVGVSTWEIRNESMGNAPIYRTEDPLEAVRIAIEAVQAGKGTSYAG